MKRTMKMALCLALVLGLLVSMSACAILGGNSNAGTYKLSSMEMMGMTLDVEALKTNFGMSDEDLDMYVELRGDGTATMKADGEEAEMKWADGEIWPVEEPEEKAAFTIEDGVLTMEIEGVKMMFTKQ